MEGGEDVGVRGGVSVLEAAEEGEGAWEVRGEERGEGGERGGVGVGRGGVGRWWSEKHGLRVNKIFGELDSNFQ